MPPPLYHHSIEVNPKTRLFGGTILGLATTFRKLMSRV